MDLSEAAAAWWSDGFVVLPGYLAGPELAAAQRDLAVVYPSAEEYHTAPAEGRNRAYTGDEFGGVIPFPFATVALSRLVVHDKLIALAEAVFATSDIRIYAAELWAKYCGAASYEQEHHRDYLNHTPLVPAADDVRWRGLEMFIWLSDVPEDHGPTHIVPLPVTAGVPALPHGYLRSQRPEFYDRERSGAGSAGTVVATARTPSTAAPRSPRRARPGSALTPATSTQTITGPAAIRGETAPSTRTGTRSPSRPPPASSSFSASRRPATPTGPRRPSAILPSATPASTPARGSRVKPGELGSNHG